MSERVIRTTCEPIHTTIDGERCEIATMPVHYLASDDGETFTVIPPELADRFRDDEEL